MPTPKLLTPASFPSMCPVFSAASHKEAFLLTDTFFRQANVEAVVWYRESIDFDAEGARADIVEFKEISYTLNAGWDYYQRKSSHNSSLKIHYDRGMTSLDNDNERMFMCRNLRILISRTNMDGLGTIIFDQGINRYEEVDDFSFPPYEKVFGTPWQTDCNSVLLLKGTAHEKPVLHTKPTYNLKDFIDGRIMDVIDLEWSNSTPPTPLSLSRQVA